MNELKINGVIWFVPNLKQALQTRSARLLVLSNLVPLFGVLFLRWSTFNLVALYWLENGIVGLFSVLQIVAVATTEKPLGEYRSRTFGVVAMVLIAGLFSWIYGMLFEAQGTFLLGSLTNPFSHGGGKPGFKGSPFECAYHLALGSLLVPFAALAIGHASSFYSDFIKNGAYKRIEMFDLLMTPYQRFGATTVVMVIGSFLAFIAPVFFLVVLLASKTWIELGLHLAAQERRTETNPT